MKFVALISGGKDSCFNICKCLHYGHELVACAHLSPAVVVSSTGGQELKDGKSVEGETSEELDSFMYQCAGFGAVQYQAECLGKPFFQRHITGSSLNQDLEYSPTEGDEVEDLFHLLAEVKQAIPDLEAVASGAIFSTYQRTRVENICSRLGLTSLSYLWQRAQDEILDEMIENGVDAIVVKVASAGLDPYRHLGRPLAALRPHFRALHARFGFHVAGEGGEYETLCLDCPAFSGGRLVIDKTEILCDGGDTGSLRILECHVEKKDREVIKQNQETIMALRDPDIHGNNHKEPDDIQLFVKKALFGLELTPFVYSRFGLVYISNISQISSATKAPEQVGQCLDNLKKILATEDCQLADVCFVHLNLRDIKSFTAVNDVYCRYFEGGPAPSRSCVQTCLPPGTEVSVAALALRGSGSKNDKASRQVLHVRSLSSWAPVCIGPYSQANILFGHLIKMSGQIGLYPPTMTIVDGGWKQQLIQSARNCAQVLSVLDSSFAMALSIVLYVNTAVVSDPLEEIQNDMLELVKSNAFVQDPWSSPGAGAGGADAHEPDWNSDSEEEGQELEALKPKNVDLVPLVTIGVPGLPKDCAVEIECIAGSRRLHHSVPLKKSMGVLSKEYSMRKENGPGWIPWPQETHSVQEITSGGLGAPVSTIHIEARNSYMESVACFSSFTLEVNNQPTESSSASNNDDIGETTNNIELLTNNPPLPNSAVAGPGRSSAAAAAAALGAGLRAVAHLLAAHLATAGLRPEHAVEVKVFYAAPPEEEEGGAAAAAAAAAVLGALVREAFPPPAYARGAVGLFPAQALCGGGGGREGKGGGGGGGGGGGATLLKVLAQAYDLPRLETELWVRERF